MTWYSPPSPMSSEMVSKIPVGVSDQLAECGDGVDTPSVLRVRYQVVTHRAANCDHVSCSPKHPSSTTPADSMPMRPVRPARSKRDIVANRVPVPARARCLALDFCVCTHVLFMRAMLVPPPKTTSLASSPGLGKPIPNWASPASCVSWTASTCSTSRARRLRWRRCSPAFEKMPPPRRHAS